MASGLSIGTAAIPHPPACGGHPAAARLAPECHAIRTADVVQ